VVTPMHDVLVGVALLSFVTAMVTISTGSTSRDDWGCCVPE